MMVRVLWMTIVLFLTVASTPTQADELSAESLYGKWLYTHILMEGGREISVNLSTTFSDDGTVVFYDPNGQERGHGTFTIQGGTILYKDDKGPQPWKVLSLEKDTLHVDHRGAEMFFKRQ